MTTMDLTEGQLRAALTNLNQLRIDIEEHLEELGRETQEAMNHGASVTVAISAVEDLLLDMGHIP